MVPASGSTSTIKDVARHAGVSIATVSRAINNPDQVDPATLALVRDAIALVRYRPSALGRMLRAECSRVVGVIIPTIANPVFGDTLQGIDEGAARAGYRLMLMTTEYDSVRESNAIDTLLEHRVDGLILTVANARENVHLDALDDVGLPYVLAHNDCSDDPLRASVSVDNFQAAVEGVTAMIAMGHRRIAMLSGTMSASDRARERYEGYRCALLAAGLTPVPVIESDFIADTLAPDALAMILGEPAGSTRPTALFCSNDRLAMVAIASLNSRSIAVPADISVMGFDGLAMGGLLAPTLASICVPNRDIGQQAWRTLQELIRVRSTRARSNDTDADILSTALHVERTSIRLPHRMRDGATLSAPARHFTVLAQ